MLKEYAMSSQITRRALQAIATDQGGYFTAQQALSVGYTYPKQHYHVAQGNWLKVARGLYRLAEYPKPPEAELMMLTLLSADRQGTPQAVVSHETALALHELGDANPAQIHLTVPRGFRKQMPEMVRLHRGALTERDWQQREGYRVTTPLRTLFDIAGSAVSWPLLEGAVRDALARGLVRRKHLLADGLSARAQARLRTAIEEAGGSSQKSFPQEAGV
jgi:predicted transcriptional regulator of viral defense system